MLIILVQWVLFLKNTPLRHMKEYESYQCIRRYDEVIYIVKNIITLLGSNSSNGISIVFLNSPARDNKCRYDNITHFEQVKELFDYKPYGTTPLARTINLLTQDINLQGNSDYPTHYIILIDGDDNQGSQVLFNTINSRPKQEYNTINILACTDDTKNIDFLNNIDTQCRYVDVIDDYVSEKQQIINIYKRIKRSKLISYYFHKFTGNKQKFIKKHNVYNKFTLGDYFVKLIIYDYKLDMMDE